MALYRFVHDFSGTIGSVTERHQQDEIIELTSEDNALLVNGDVVPLEVEEPEDVAADEDTAPKRRKRAK